MDLNLERIAFGTIVGVTGAAVAAGAGRERNQQINLGEKFDEIAGADGAGFHEVLMRVARIASAHEYVHHIMNMNLGLFEGQMRGVGEGQRPSDVRREDVMTNATGRNGMADDGRRHRHVVYKGSESEYVVGPDVPDRTLLKTSAVMVTTAVKQSDGSLLTSRLTAEEDGINPPM
jgi:hypothetical protein